MIGENLDLFKSVIKSSSISWGHDFFLIITEFFIPSYTAYRLIKTGA